MHRHEAERMDPSAAVEARHGASIADKWIETTLQRGEIKTLWSGEGYAKKKAVLSLSMSRGHAHILATLPVLSFGDRAFRDAAFGDVALGDAAYRSPRAVLRTRMGGFHVFHVAGTYEYFETCFSQGYCIGGGIIHFEKMWHLLDPKPMRVQRVILKELWHSYLKAWILNP